MSTTRSGDGEAVAAGCRRSERPQLQSAVAKTMAASATTIGRELLFRKTRKDRLDGRNLKHVLRVQIIAVRRLGAEPVEPATVAHHRTDESFHERVTETGRRRGRPPS